MWVSNRWLNCRTQLTGAVVSGGVAMLVVAKVSDVQRPCPFLLFIFFLLFYCVFDFILLLSIHFSLSFSVILVVTLYPFFNFLIFLFLLFLFLISSF